MGKNRLWKKCQGDIDGQYYLGLMYFVGLGLNQDYTEASKWFEKSANQGNAKAQSNLGALYHFGKGINQDDKEAFK